MAKNSGGTRYQTRTTPAQGGYASGGSVSNWGEQIAKRDAMRASLFAFGSSHDFDQDTNSINHAFNEDDNVRGYRIEVEANPTFNAEGDVVKYDMVYRTQLNSYRYVVGPTANRAYYRLMEDADKTFTDIEKAYKHIDAITRKMNKIKLR